MIEIMALLMFIGDPQELKEMTYTPTDRDWETN